MAQRKYEMAVEDYLRLTERYEVHIEYIDGRMVLHDGTPVILLGDIVTEGPISTTQCRGLIIFKPFGNLEF